MLSAFAYFVALGALLPTLPRYVTGPLQGTSVAVGIVSGAASLTALVLNLWAGHLGDRRGRRLLLVTGAGLTTVCVAGYLVATSLPVLVALRLLAGAGEALFYVGAASAITDLAPDPRRGEAISLFSLALQAGIGVGPVLGEMALADHRFSTVWLVAASSVLISTLVALRIPDTRTHAHSPHSSRSPVHPVAIRPGVVLATGIWGLAGFNTFVPLYALQLGLSGSRFFFVTFSVILLLFRSLGARIPDRLGAAMSVRAALVLSAIGLGMIGLWRHPLGLFGGTVVFGGGHALLYPALLTLAVSRVPPTERGSVVGTMTSFLDLGLGLGPVSLGAVAGAFGYQSTFLAAASVALAGLFLFPRSMTGR